MNTNKQDTTPHHTKTKVPRKENKKVALIVNTNRKNRSTWPQVENQ